MKRRFAVNVLETQLSIRTIVVETNQDDLESAVDEARERAKTTAEFERGPQQPLPASAMEGFVLLGREYDTKGVLDESGIDRRSF